MSSKYLFVLALVAPRWQRCVLAHFLGTKPIHFHHFLSSIFIPLLVADWLVLLTNGQSQSLHLQTHCKILKWWSCYSSWLRRWPMSCPVKTVDSTSENAVQDLFVISVEPHRWCYLLFFYCIEYIMIKCIGVPVRQGKKKPYTCSMVVSTVASEQESPGFESMTIYPGPVCMEVACSPCVCMGYLRVFQLSPTV